MLFGIQVYAVWFWNVDYNLIYILVKLINVPNLNMRCRCGIIVSCSFGIYMRSYVIYVI